MVKGAESWRAGILNVVLRRCLEVDDKCRSRRNLTGGFMVLWAEVFGFGWI